MRGPAMAGWVRRVAVGVLVPGQVVAHSPLPGLEGFYTSLLHPAGAPEPLLCTLALGLLLGAEGSRGAPRVWAAFLITSAAGVAWPLLAPGPAAVEGFVLGMALAAAVAALIMAVPWRVAIAGAGGLAVGLGVAPDPGPLDAVVITMAGSFCGANLLLLLTFGAVDVARERLPGLWFVRAVRIAAGWLIAVILMWGAFSYVS